MTSRERPFRIFDWQRALLDSDLPRETKLVGWALSTFTNKYGGNAHPGETLLADKLGPMTTRTVRTHLARLRADGFITRTLRGSVAENRRWADLYELSFPEGTTGSGFPEVDGDHGKPVSGDPADHRKSGTRPPETERTDHRKLASAQQPITSTHINKASGSSDPDAPAPKFVGDPLHYGDPFTDDSKRIDTAAKYLGHLKPYEVRAVAEMVRSKLTIERIIEAMGEIRGGQPRQPAA